MDKLSDEQLRRSFEIGQGSIWKSLLHLYAAEYVWLEALTGNEDPLTPGDAEGKLPGNQEGPEAIASLSELQERWSDLDERWSRSLEELSPDSLEDPVFKINSLTGERSGTHRIDVLLHVCTHAQYTTAQAINMMRHAGVQELPDPMLISFARREFSANDG